MSRPILLGHRGARQYARENTITAFELALEHGCDGIEFDVRRTRDGRAIICHDAHLQGHDVARSTYLDLIETDPSLTCLEDVVGRFHARAFLYIELKVGGLEDAVIRVLRESPPTHGYVVASFLPEVVLAMHERTLPYGEEGRAPLGLICRNQRQLSRWPELPVKYVMPRHSLVSRALVEELHSAGKTLITWTVNDEQKMRRMAELGVDGMLSDDTQLLGHTLGRSA